MNISVKAFENADPDSAVKAHVNLTIDNAFVVKNLSVVEGKNGLFVNMPHHKSNEVGEDGKAVYKDDAFPLTKGLRDKISEAAILSYENKGQEVIIEYDSLQNVQNKTNPEKSGKEGARQGKPSVLTVLHEDSKVPGADKPIKLSKGAEKDTKKVAGAER
ncbi:MAG: SpoVG family protein [Lachnospiraceae bacterium]|nr:SpoVG family protein [Lachnospiraceae bacterium]